MKGRLSRFHPPFLKQLDRYLLQNHPIIWMSKVHLVLFYCGIVGLGCGVLGFIPLSRYDLSDPETHFLWACIPTGIGFLYWIIHVSNYTIERLFGNSSLLQRLRLQGCYLACVLSFASLPFFYAQSIAYRGVHSIPDHLLSEQNKAFDFIQDRVFSESKNHLQITHELGWAEDSVFQELSLTEKQQVLDTYFELCLDYHGLELSISGKKMISEAFLNQEILLDTAHTRHALYPDHYTVLDSKDETITDRTKDNLHVLTQFKQNWKFQDWDFQQMIALEKFSQSSHQGSVLALLYMLLYSFLLLLLFVRLGFQHFFYSLACCLMLFLVLIPVQLGLLEGLEFLLTIHPDDDTLLFACWGFVDLLIWISLLVFSYSQRSQQHFRFWNTGLLMLLTLLSPVLLLFVALIFSEFSRDNYDTEAICWGIGVALILWNAAFDKLLIASQAKPTNH